MPITPLAVASMSIRRRNFQGVNDKYMPWRASPVGGPNVVEGVRKEGGFVDIGADPALMNELYRDVARERMALYKQYVRFYDGKHFENEWEDGEKKPIFNFSKVVVDKAVDFFVANGFNIRAIEGNELVAQAFDLVWKSNDKLNLFRKLALNAGITGDAFMYVTLKTKDDAGKLLEKSKWSIVLTALDPFFVFPIFSSKNPGTMDACLVQYPIGKSNTGAVTYESLWLTPQEVQVYRDTNLISKDPNPFETVPIVHFPNYLDPIKIWGQSDLAPIVPLNEEYNIVANSVRKIIKYHAEPTTIIFGARASRLEKGAKKVWSGLPIDARVENLAYNADLTAVEHYLGNIEQTIYKVGCIPSVLFQLHGQGGLSVSNTSGLALRMMYQPLTDKVNRKKEAFTESFKRTNGLILKALDIIGSDVRTLADYPEMILELTPEYTDPLPFDEVAQLDADTKKVALGVTSEAALLRKYNPGEDTKRLTIEILADRVARMLMETEKSKIVNGRPPNLTSIFTSSIAISEEVDEMRDAVEETSSSLSETHQEEVDAQKEDELEKVSAAAAAKTKPQPNNK